MERRNSDRYLDRSMLLVNGHHVSGVPSSETTYVDDVSHDEISFHLSHSVNTDVLDLRIASQESEGDL